MNRNKNFTLLLFCSLFLVGCTVVEDSSQENNETAFQEQENKLTGTFMLKAEHGYIQPDNEEDAKVYIINTTENTVHIEGQGKSFSREDREIMGEGLVGEEMEELFGEIEVSEPEHDLTYLEATKYLIVIEYEDQRVEFTGLSESFFESESGIRYRIEENTSVSDYQASLTGE